MLQKIKNKQTKQDKEAATGGVPKKKCYAKFRKIHRKTPVSESYF